MKLNLNMHIISTLYYKGQKTLNINYLKYLFDYIVNNQVLVNQLFISRIQEHLKEIKKNIIILV
jgi:hypothetical protein